MCVAQVTHGVQPTEAAALSAASIDPAWLAAPGAKEVSDSPASRLACLRDETCPVSSEGGTRRVQLVRKEGRDVSS